ncbi:MAG: hypothetical protein ACJ786_24320 [Catenulispora sp.]
MKTLRTARGWLGIALAVVVALAGAASGGHEASAHSDPHATAAQREADRVLTTFLPPPGSTKATGRPDAVPPDLLGPPIMSGAETQATAVAWYYASITPGQVLGWVSTHPPTGSRPEGSGSGSTGPGFLSFQYPTPNSSLIVTPETGTDGRTVIRLDASVIWTPSRAPDSLIGGGAKSVTVVTTNRLNPQAAGPAAAPLTSTDPQLIARITALVNALQPPIPGTRRCPNDDGTRVRISLASVADVTASPVGCGDVVITTVGGGSAQTMAGGNELVSEVYALFGIAQSRP